MDNDRIPPRLLAMWGLAASTFLYAFLQRVSPSVMVEDLMRDFGVGAAVLGSLSAFYLYAYAGLQIPLGLLFDRFGVRRLMVASIAVSGAGSLIFAAAPAVEIAYLGRALIGAGAACSFVGALTVTALWLPPARFAMLAGLAMAEVAALARVLTVALAATLALVTAALVMGALVTRRALDRVALLVEAAERLLLTAGVIHPRLRFHASHGRLEIAAELVALVITVVVATLALLAERTALHGIRIAAHLLHLLLAIGHDDAGVMLRVLQVVLGEDGVAGGLGVTCQREILLGDMGGRAPDFHIRSVRFEAARQRILTFAVVVVTTAASTILLSLPHAIPVLDPR